MSQTIVKTRIIPRKITDNIVSRSRLFKKFEENSNKSIILVLGPAGYGKTTAVIDYLNNSAKQYAWLYLNNDIDNPGLFLIYFINSLKVLNPEFGENSLELINSFTSNGQFSQDGTNSIKISVGSIINEFVSAFKDDTYIVIDDLHNLAGNEWLNIFFETLNENMPDNLHIIITSRNVPEFNTAKLTAKRKLAKIQSNDLNFTADETESLIKDIYSISCKKEDIKTLLGKIEGWITGLHLVLQAYGIEFTSAGKTNKNIDDIFSYFAEDIFSQLDDETKDFLLVTSLLDNFTAEICKTELDLKNSDNILDELVKKNLFTETSQHITETGDSITSYSYHNLFRDFLREKLKNLKSDEELKTLAGKIFDHYNSKGDYLNAVEFALESGEFSKAAELIIKNHENLFQFARFETLNRWLGCFSEESLNSSPDLLFIKGKLFNFFKSNTEEAGKIFFNLIKNFPDNQTIYVNANSEISEIFRLTGKPEEALNIFKNLYRLDTAVELKVRIIISLCKSYYRLGSRYYEEILKLLNEAEELCSINNIPAFISDIYSLFGRIYLNKGEFVKSLHYFESNLAKDNNIYRRFQTISDIVLLYSWSGEYNKAKEYFDDAENLMKKYSLNHLEKDLKRLNALLRFEAGDYEMAAEDFNYLCNADIKKGISSFLLTYYLIISEAKMLMGEFKKAEEFLEIASKYRNEKDEYLKIEFDYHNALLDKYTTVNTKTEKTILATLKVYESFNSVYNKAQVLLNLADLYFKKGEVLTAMEYFDNCLKISEENKYHSFLIQHFLQLRYLFDHAFEMKLHTDFILQIKNKVNDKYKITWFSDECKKRITAEIPELKDIKLRSFGRCSIYVRGKMIPEESWIRKKSKLLLVYLLVNRGLKIQKDKVLGLFFSELSAESADNIFHQAVTNIRNVLKPDSPVNISAASKPVKGSKKEKEDKYLYPSFLIYEDKILQMAPLFEYDTDITEFSRLCSMVISPETNAADKEKSAKEAIELYEGEFLPGYYDEWIEEMRSVLEHKFTETCEELLKVLYNRKNFTELTEYSEKLLITDKLHEEANYYVISGYIGQGNTTMAKKKFSQLLKNYDDEYGEKPPKELLNRISLILD